MGDNSGISWTDATWNPIVGCSVTSPGCTNCYAMEQAARMVRMNADSHYAGTTQHSKAGPVWTGVLKDAPEHILTAPLRWTKPRRIFVNSMSDLFHEAVTDAQLDRVFAVMALAPQHTFQVLTKRSARMRAYYSNVVARGRVARACVDLWINKIADAPALDHIGRWPVEAIGDPEDPDDLTLRTWPLPNVWLGVSAEDQRRADERGRDLAATPAAVRFISAEPLLGPIDFHAVPVPFLASGSGKVDWIIVGGESGLKARSMDVAWAEAIVHQARSAGVAVYVKQLGAHPMVTPGVMGAYPAYLKISDRKGLILDEWPEELRVQQFPRLA